jgi:hypothetical protein
MQQPYVQEPVLLPKPSSPQGYPEQQFAPQYAQQQPTAPYAQPMMAPQGQMMPQGQQPMMMPPQQYAQQPAPQQMMMPQQYAQPQQFAQQPMMAPQQPVAYASSHALVPVQQVDPAASAALMMQQQAMQSQQQQQAMGAMTSMMMLQTMQQMQQQSGGGASGGGGAPAAPAGPLQLDVTVEWEYCGSHTPAEDREWPENKYRILVKPESTAESIAQEALSRADMGEFGIVQHKLKTEEGFEISPNDPIMLVSACLPLRRPACRPTIARQLTHPHPLALKTPVALADCREGREDGGDRLLSQKAGEGHSR